MYIVDLTDTINMTPYSLDAYLDRGAEYFRQRKYKINDFEKHSKLIIVLI